MADFTEVELLADSEVLDAHEFPLFSYVALFQKLRSTRENMSYCAIVVERAVVEAEGEEALLNMVAASGYLDEDSDLTFRFNEQSAYFYCYFNFKSIV